MKLSGLSLTIAIPAYNEAATIRSVVQQASRAARRFTSDYEILVVNDGSTDETAGILSVLAKKDGHIVTINHPVNQGFSGAIKTCYRKARKHIIFLLPADGQIDAGDINIFLRALPHADVVVGYRTSNPEPFTRKLNSFVFHVLFRTLFGVKLREISTSILWRKSVLDSLDITAIPRSALIEPEVVFRAWKKGYRFAQVGIPYYPRQGGKAKGASPLMILMTLRELMRLWIGTRLRMND